MVNWDNPALNLDFGRPVDGYESPWSGAQFHFIYDSARMAEEDLPRSYAELSDWIAMNPGRFTYIAPGPGRLPGYSLRQASALRNQWRAKPMGRRIRSDALRRTRAGALGLAQ